MNFDTFFDQQLNSEQKKIVSAHQGILLVRAGAGSGKTRIITARITHLMLKHNVPAYGIVALTFTNKAAREMKERVIHFLSKSHGLPYVGTFHAYCLKLLREQKHLIKIPEFSILDDSDQEKLLKLILQRHSVNKKITPKQISSLISSVKNESITGDIAWDLIPDPFTRELVASYEREKTLARCYDFDDLLLEALRLFRNQPAFKERYQNAVRHLLIDEYQDTNKVQHALLQALSCSATNSFALDSLCIVGDEDQSIYSWRGATVKNIVYFKKDFPTTQSFIIDQNYRSVQPILDVANDIIARNKERNPKNLWSEKKARDRVRIISCMSGYHEADIAVQYGNSYLTTYPEQSCAFLYRSHYQSRILEEALIKQSIPYKIIGGIHFYDRLEIKDLLSFLRLMVNPFDRVSFSRIYNTPTRGLGDKFLELFFAHWDQNHFMSWDAVAQDLIHTQAITGLKAKALQYLITVLQQTNSKPSDTLEILVNQLGYISYLKEAFDEDEAEIKVENVKELINAVRAHEERNPQTTLHSFLEDVALLQEAVNQQDTDQNCLQLMTLHAAKGLEFDSVILVGLEETVLPSTHALAEGNVEEERRLLYVGITRARERLLITHARYRHTYGSMTEQRLSRFIQEMDQSLATFYDGSQWGLYQIKSFAQQWFAGIAVPKPTVKVAKKIEWSEDPFEETSSNKSPFKIKQKVTHATFGTGVIEKIEVSEPDKVYLTIQFSYERKKIDARFVKLV